ncbi:TetR/AcrR family transcriptional regulator [Streptomyces sp. 12297]|uniref:TetR/AcrR family transcriptional regulator n=1 Tax=Streptomyces sp. NBC_00239 TaxID=2903640 RepID=UPI002E2A17F6|nr:TetR/AcrR family transcriptional regulator [Streptomyces sp. NBC_00239]
MTPSGRPAVPEVIWARPERAGRGPRPAHSRESIAAEAVRIADVEGIDAVSMRRVAAGIGAGTMSLYNYVPRKEDLYELMVDAVSAEYDYPARPAGDWQARLLHLARQTRALMHRHPWLPRLISPVYGFSPHALRYLEYSLACMDGLEIAAGQKMELIASVNGLVTTFVSGELATAERSRSLPWTEDQDRAVRGAYLMGQVATGRYPRLAEALGEGLAPQDMDEVFERMLRRLFGSFLPTAP